MTCSPPDLDFARLTGQTEAHLVPGPGGVLVHRQVLEPLQRLHRRAQAAGFELTLASGFRSFERQMSIWQRKLRGELPLLSRTGERLDVDALSPDEQLQALLRWSALPGTSRHHWGTDFDIYDAAAVPAGYHLQLVPEEYTGDGPFAPMTQWLQQAVASDSGEGFFFPYAEDIGGVAPEPWHLSYRPLAQQFLQAFEPAVFQALLQGAGWPLADSIAGRAEEIYRRYICLRPDA
ncbi:M15 family metallopeptidase [Pseudomaricurvus sp. HS19]|uniref:M15 family metallopeptidase n=1 Tax=Pseudomaricurvus sp. HS19 TaxID=2692626 RepID=UPI00136FB9FF|nr:M15 family metallopeptidase [Pseudomaricurvus sp. HS19]MYM64330.1 D-alanyl-D-alanine carboxypeptidase family protein [Pseudomaricurvus sp. HS19]